LVCDKDLDARAAVNANLPGAGGCTGVVAPETEGGDGVDTVVIDLAGLGCPCSPGDRLGARETDGDVGIDIDDED